ncbi:hypothetical protein SAMN05216174_1266 [Actinokineospora iranica]|uniref:Uncharacterized protein n=2 Tax=Actinokineospora iranica TaxID=1271860 RepID=A0A1G6Z6D1_9PSEU|nr:hypothetical protein SAMN05216174_1266 [Actinokineospora iranica]
MGHVDYLASYLDADDTDSVDSPYRATGYPDTAQRGKEYRETDYRDPEWPETESPESPATGLAKFDLGSIPASVTPPKSWRHAAWFAVASAILVLVGLTYAAVALMTGPRKPDVVDALPGLPALPSHQQPQPPTERPTVRGDQPSSEVADTPTTVAVRRPSASRTVTVQTTTTALTPSTTGTAPSTVVSSPPPRPSTTSAAPPSRSTVTSPLLVAPANDAEVMGDLTEAYYREVTEDPDAAYALTAGHMRRAGQAEIERRYADVERVEVQQIVIDPNNGTTRSTLRVVHKDGTVTTEERELVFTYGSDPRISDERAAA